MNRHCTSLACFEIALSLFVWSAIPHSPSFGQLDRDRDVDVYTENGLQSQVRFLPPNQRPPSNVRLGIYSRNTPTGVVVNRVERNSIAEQSGLEVQDVILSVGGYQVGIVDGRTFDVGDELVRRMDNQGRVTLLVLNHRDGRLVNIPLQLVATGEKLVGTVTTGSRQLVSPGMLLSVRLIDVTYPQWNDVTIAETQVALTGRWPMSFELDIDPRSVRPDHRYALEGMVTHRGNTILVTAQPVPVPSQYSSARPAINLIPANPAFEPSLPPNSGRPPDPGTPIDQVGAWYQDFLGRELNSRERTVWQRELAKGKSIDDILATILGSSEYYDRFRGNAPEYISEVYGIVNGRNPSPGEMQRWLSRMAQLRNVRYNLVVEMMRDRGR